MRHSVKLIAITAFLVCLSALGYLIWQIYFFTPSDADLVTPSATANALNPAAMLAERMGQGVAAPTPEQILEEQQVEQEQVATASGWLHAADAKQRIAGAEQLAAYPTPEAEKHLLEALAGDVDAEVRATAANSLGYFHQLAPETIGALLKALHDENDIAQNALNILVSRLSRLEAGKPEFQKLAASLKSQAKNKQLSKPIRTALLSALSDQGVK